MIAFTSPAVTEKGLEIVTFLFVDKKLEMFRNDGTDVKELK